MLSLGDVTITDVSAEVYEIPTEQPEGDGTLTCRPR